MVNYESSLRQKNLASLMLKRQGPASGANDKYYQPKLVNDVERDRDRLRSTAYTKNYNNRDESNYYNSYPDNPNHTTMNSSNNRYQVVPGSYHNQQTKLSPGRSSVPGLPIDNKYYGENLTRRDDLREISENSNRGVPRRSVMSNNEWSASNEHHKIAPPNERIVADSKFDEAPPFVENHRPSKKEVDRSDLTKMRKKYKNKISANISGTKFEIGIIN